MDYEKEIKRARVLLLQSTDRKQNEQGEKILEKVIAEAEGTSIAQEAKTILKQVKRENPSRPDPVLIEANGEWQGIHGLFDGQLVLFLKKISQQPQVVVSMKQTVVEDLRKWLQKALPVVSRDMGSDKLRLLNRFLATIDDLEDYAFAIEELKGLRVALFDIRIEDVSEEVYEALGRWKTEAAWHSVASLRPALASREDAIRQLEELIAETEDVAAELQKLFTTHPTNPPGDWLEMQLLLDSTRQLDAFWRKHKHLIPEEQKSSLLKTMQSSKQEGRTFLEKEATHIAGLEDVRAFWKEYQGLQVTNTELEPDFEPGWIEHALNVHLNGKSNLLFMAMNPNNLDKVAADLLTEKRGLPPDAQTRFEKYAAEIHQMMTDWNAMVAGKVFDTTVAYEGLVPVPKMFEKEAPVFQEYLRQIEDAFQNIEREGEAAVDRETFDGAVEVAQEILDERPGHVEALRLKEAAERCILDAALLNWEFEEFLVLVQADPGADYAELGRGKELLQRFKERVQQAPFSTWQEANQWWTSWEALSNELPLKVPGAFFRAALNQQAVRKGETEAVLKEALSRPLSQQECEEVLSALDEEFGFLISPDINVFKMRFDHKRQYRLIEQYIEEEQWETARLALGMLNEDLEETQCLNTMLDVNQARAKGVNDLAAVLRKKWHHIERYYKGINDILLQALEEAWERSEDDGALENLKYSLNRVCRSKARPARGLLLQWQEWLAVEKAIGLEISVQNIKRLVAYLDQHSNTTRQKHLSKLIQRWQEKDNNLMLAWAYEAFDTQESSILAAADNQAVAAMVETSKKVVADVEEALRTSDDLSLESLNKLTERLANEENCWGRLGRYLQLLPHEPERYEIPEDLVRTKDRLRNLIDIQEKLDRMEQEDLRNKTDEVNRIEQKIRNDFADFAMQSILEQRIKRLIPLTGLKFYELQLLHQANNCGNLDYYFINGQPGQFAELQERIQAIIQFFDETAMRGGPMWQLISEEYAGLIHDSAKILMPLDKTDLAAMASQILELEKEEQQFREAIRYLQDNQPPVHTKFTPSKHEGYLKHFPRKAPRSQRVYTLFQGYASRDAMAIIITRSHEAGLLPGWMKESLKKTDH